MANDVKVSDMDKDFEKLRTIEKNMKIAIKIDGQYCSYKPRCQFLLWPDNRCFLFEIDKLDTKAAANTIRCEECLKIFGN